MTSAQFRLAVQNPLAEDERSSPGSSSDTPSQRPPGVPHITEIVKAFRNSEDEPEPAITGFSGPTPLQQADAAGDPQSATGSAHMDPSLITASSHSVLGAQTLAQMGLEQLDDGLWSVPPSIASDLLHPAFPAAEGRDDGPEASSLRPAVTSRTRTFDHAGTASSQDGTTAKGMSTVKGTMQASEGKPSQPRQKPTQTKSRRKHTQVTTQQHDSNLGDDKGSQKAVFWILQPDGSQQRMEMSAEGMLNKFGANGTTQLDILGATPECLSPAQGARAETTCPKPTRLEPTKDAMLTSIGGISSYFSEPSTRGDVSTYGADSQKNEVPMKEITFVPADESMGSADVGERLDQSRSPDKSDDVSFLMAHIAKFGSQAFNLAATPQIPGGPSQHTSSAKAGVTNRPKLGRQSTGAPGSTWDGLDSTTKSVAGELLDLEKASGRILQSEAAARQTSLDISAGPPPDAEETGRFSRYQGTLYPPVDLTSSGDVEISSTKTGERKKNGEKQGKQKARDDVDTPAAQTTAEEEHGGRTTDGDSFDYELLSTLNLQETTVTFWQFLKERAGEKPDLDRFFSSTVGEMGNQQGPERTDPYAEAAGPPSENSSKDSLFGDVEKGPESSEDGGRGTRMGEDTVDTRAPGDDNSTTGQLEMDRSQSQPPKNGKKKKGKKKRQAQTDAVTLTNQTSADGSALGTVAETTIEMNSQGNNTVQVQTRNQKRKAARRDRRANPAGAEPTTAAPSANASAGLASVLDQMERGELGSTTDIATAAAVVSSETMTDTAHSTVEGGSLDGTASPGTIATTAESLSETTPAKAQKNRKRRNGKGPRTVHRAESAGIRTDASAAKDETMAPMQALTSVTSTPRADISRLREQERHSILMQDLIANGKESMIRRAEVAESPNASVSLTTSMSPTLESEERRDESPALRVETPPTVSRAISLAEDPQDDRTRPTIVLMEDAESATSASGRRHSRPDDDTFSGYEWPMLPRRHSIHEDSGPRLRSLAATVHQPVVEAVPDAYNYRDSELGGDASDQSALDDDAADSGDTPERPTFHTNAVRRWSLPTDDHTFW